MRTDVLLELAALYQLLFTDVKDEGTIGRAQKTFDPVHADVAILCGFRNRQCEFQVIGTCPLVDFILRPLN